jgi:hypothetical protein
MVPLTVTNDGTNDRYRIKSYGLSHKLNNSPEIYLYALISTVGNILAGNLTGKIITLTTTKSTSVLNLIDLGLQSSGIGSVVTSINGQTGDVEIATGGSVTSVGLSLPDIFSVTNSPVTTSGTLTATLASQTQKTFLGAPSTANGTPTFRGLVAADIPALTTYLAVAGDTMKGDLTMKSTSDSALSGSQSIIFQGYQTTAPAGAFTKSLVMNASGVLTFDGTAISLAGHPHTYDDLTGTVPT